MTGAKTAWEYVFGDEICSGDSPWFWGAGGVTDFQRDGEWWSGRIYVQGSQLVAVELKVTGEPVAQGNHSIGRGRIYETTKGHKLWRDTVKLAAEQLAHGIAPMSGAIMAHMKFLIERPASHTKQDGKLRKGKPMRPLSRPDLSKLIRCAEDAITDGGIWCDDSRVVEYCKTRKVYTTNPAGLHFAAVCMPESYEGLGNRRNGAVKWP